MAEYSLLKTSPFPVDMAEAPWWTSCRLTLAIVGMFGTVCLYMMRANMSVAIVCMTNDNSSTLPEDIKNLTTAWKSEIRHIHPAIALMNKGQSKEGEFEWDRQLRGWVLSSFFIGYMVTQLPGGWLAHRFGAKVVIGTGVGVLSVFSLLTPVSARSSVYLLMAVQAIKGLASGFFYPAFYHIFGRWTTINDRSFIVALFSSGSSSGAILSSILSGMLCEYGFDGGWPSIFYIFGIVGIAWCVVWYFTGFSSPQEHPRISDAELSYISALTPAKSQVKSSQVPWVKLVTCIPLYALCSMELAQGWNWYVALTTLPQYMKDVLKFDMTQNGLYNALPYIANVFITVLGSIMADCIISKKLLSVTRTRKLLQTLAMLPGAALSIGVAFLPGDQTVLAIILITLWVGLMGCKNSGGNANSVEIAPKYSGLVMGIQNMFSNLPGVVAPPVVAAMTTMGSRQEWQRVFLLNAILAAIGLLIYVIFTSAEEQEWAKVDIKTEDTGGTGSLQQYMHKAMDNTVFVGTSDETELYMMNRSRVLEDTILRCKI